MTVFRHLGRYLANPMHFPFFDQLTARASLLLGRGTDSLLALCSGNNPRSCTPDHARALPNFLDWWKPTYRPF